MRRPSRKTTPSAAFFAAGHDGGVEALAEAGGKVVELMRAVDLDGFAGGRKRDLAVIAAAQMGLQFGAGFRSYLVVDQVIEQSEKFSARHFSTPFFRRK